MRTRSRFAALCHAHTRWRPANAISPRVCVKCAFLSALTHQISACARVCVYTLCLRNNISCSIPSRNMQQCDKQQMRGANKKEKKLPTTTTTKNARCALTRNGNKRHRRRRRPFSGWQWHCGTNESRKHYKIYARAEAARVHARI